MMFLKLILLCWGLFSLLTANESQWQSKIQERFYDSDFEIQSPFNPISHTLFFKKDPRIFEFKDIMAQRLTRPMDQKIANFINQIYYSMKFNFDFCKHVYVQSGKIFRKINIEQSAKRAQGKRVRLIFIGFQY